MSQFWFWLYQSSPILPVEYGEGRYSLQYLTYKPNHYFEETMIFKVLKQSSIYVDVIGTYEKPNNSLTCTLFVTDNFEARISITCHLSTARTINYVFNSVKKEYLRFYLFDSTLLEKYCLDLLGDRNVGGAFVTNIDSFTIGSVFKKD